MTGSNKTWWDRIGTKLGELPDTSSSQILILPSGFWISISDSWHSLKGELDRDENERGDSSFSDSVISPSSGSLFPPESLLREELLFFFLFFDFDFIPFFLDRPLSSLCEPFHTFFLFDDLSPRCFLRDETSGLGDLRFSFRDSEFFFNVCCSTESVASSFILTSSNLYSCYSQR